MAREQGGEPAPAPVALLRGPGASESLTTVLVAFGANNNLTWHHYQVIFTEGLPAIRDTLIIAVIGMPLGGLYGVLVGYLIARKRFPGRRAMELETADGPV